MGMQAVKTDPLPVPAAVAGFAGACILWQNAVCLKSCGISFGTLFGIKLLHALFAFVLCGAWMCIAGEEAVVCFGGIGDVSLQNSVPGALFLIGLLLAAGCKKAARRLLLRIRRGSAPPME